MARRAVWLLILLAAAVSRLCYLNVIWVEEGYPLAAAQQMARGAALYRDIWFDKPPAFPLWYLAWGAAPGWPLRLMGIAFVLLAAWSAARAARLCGAGGREPLWAAALTAFFFTFDIHSTAIALTPDLLTVPLHFLAAGLAIAGWPLAAGAAAGLAFCFNVKALLILAACLLWQWRRAHRVVAGFTIALAGVAAWLAASHAMPDFWQQVWVWGAAYSADPISARPWVEFARRTMNWAGFHAALVVAAAAAAWRIRDWRWAAWLIISLAGVALGLRFFPRYYFHLLPVFVLLAARGFAAMPRRWAIAAALPLLIPLVRFGPRYIAAAQGKPWSDLAMFESSKRAAEFLRNRAGGRDTLFVWGYRPELYPLTGLRAGSRFLDSQPLTGVFADRHLITPTPTLPDWAARNRREVQAAPQPDWIADGLGPYQPALDVRLVLDPAMARYELAGEVEGFRLYRRVR